MTQKITNHVELALNRLPQRQKDQPNLEALLTVFSEVIQEAEDGIYPLLTDRTIDTAIGAQLDVIGRIVKEDREGLEDEDYRIRLRARVATNRSHGTLDDLLNIVALMLLPDTALTKATMEYPASVLFDISGLSVIADLANAIIEFLRDGAAAGVRVQLVTSVSGDDTLYTSRSAYLSGSTPAGSGELAVDDTIGFPASGSLKLDTGLASEETVAYSSKTDTTFVLSGTTAEDHDANTDVSLVGSKGKGLSSIDDLTKGGFIARVNDSPGDVSRVQVSLEAIRDILGGDPQYAWIGEPTDIIAGVTMTPTGDAFHKIADVVNDAPWGSQSLAVKDGINLWSAVDPSIADMDGSETVVVIVAGSVNVLTGLASLLVGKRDEGDSFKGWEFNTNGSGELIATIDNGPQSASLQVGSENTAPGWHVWGVRHNPAAETWELETELHSASTPFTGEASTGTAMGIGRFRPSITGHGWDNGMLIVVRGDLGTTMDLGSVVSQFHTLFTGA